MLAVVGVQATLRLNSDVEEAGAFECSNELYNRIHEAVRWTQLSNLFSVQSDCPARERFAYGGAFTSRLVTNLRTQKGYTYSPGAGLRPLAARRRTRSDAARTSATFTGFHGVHCR